MERRVVITGLGAITPIGNNVEEFWDGIKSGRCGIDKIKNFDTSNFKVKIAGEVKNYNPEDYFDRRSARRLDKYSQFAIIAAKEAMKYDIAVRRSKRIQLQIFFVLHLSILHLGFRCFT